ncbi:MAG: hypothetical protein AUH46_01295 [Gemmatimonadetes bacterium 13_1_40CM_70_15]|nr:MAG: hypothetical protein AUH46_01295 [Gemmatimonadetes bacterium 13_1_40CM_70_15]
MAGRVPPERVVAVVAEVYYRETGSGKRETWQPLMDVIERAHPGVIRLAGIAARPGFAVELTERPFPKQYEADLKRAAEAILLTLGESGRETGYGRRRPGLVGRLTDAVRRLFSAST